MSNPEEMVDFDKMLSDNAELLKSLRSRIDQVHKDAEQLQSEVLEDESELSLVRRQEIASQIDQLIEKQEEINKPTKRKLSPHFNHRRGHWIFLG